MGIRYALAMACMMLLLLSCSVAQETDPDAPVSEEPDILLTDATYTLGRSGQRPVTVTARTIAIYLKTDKAVLEDLTFEQPDETGTTDLSGSAAMATVDTESNDASLQGTVRIDKRSEQFSVEAENLFWDEEEQLLQTEPDGRATVRFDEGNVLSGTGFSADLDQGVYEFASLDQGVLRQ
jgi:LPS export ABC transporter protein LptC